MNEPPRVRIAATGRLPQPGFIGKFVALTTVALVIGGVLVAAVTFSLILLPIVLLVGAIGFGYFWFKTRGVRRQFSEQVKAMQEQMSSQGQNGPGGPSGPRGSAGPAGRARPADGVVIDGDFIQEAPSRPGRSKAASNDPIDGRIDRID